MSAMSRQRRYQLRHRRAGLCLACSRPVVSGGSFCEVHRRKRNLKNREWQRRKFTRKARYRKAESYNSKQARNSTFGESTFPNSGIFPPGSSAPGERNRKAPCKSNANGAWLKLGLHFRPKRPTNGDWMAWR